MYFVVPDNEILLHHSTTKNMLRELFIALNKKTQGTAHGNLFFSNSSFCAQGALHLLNILNVRESYLASIPIISLLLAINLVILSGVREPWLSSAKS